MDTSDGDLFAQNSVRYRGIERGEWKGDAINTTKCIGKHVSSAFVVAWIVDGQCHRHAGSAQSKSRTGNGDPDGADGYRQKRNGSFVVPLNVGKRVPPN